VARNWRARLARPKVALPIAWAIGIPFFTGLFILGWIGDSRGFWSSRPCFTNMLTALTGAGIAVPFALTVLNWFARTQDEAAQWSGTTKYAKQLITSLERSLWPSGEVMANNSELLLLLRPIEGLHSNLLVFNARISQPSLARTHENGGISPDATKVRRLFQFSISVFLQRTEEIQGLAEDCLPDSSEADVNAVQFNADWQTMDRVIRPTVAQNYGANWIPINVYKILSYRAHPFPARPRRGRSSRRG
jgi:hypothetical protein